MLRLTSFLEGQWVEGQAPFSELHDASTGAVVGACSTRGLSAGGALAYARRVGGSTLRAMTFVERAALIKALGKAVHAHRDELLALSTASYGATRGDAKFDVDGASGTLAFYANLGAGLGDRRFLLDGEAEGIGRSTRFVGQHLLVPRRGVALHINAFNFPAWGMCEKLAVSLLAGVPALVKPATSTAQVAWRIVQIWQEEGLLPAGVVSLWCGAAGDLLDHLEVQDTIAFTGSGDTARALRGHARVVEFGIPLNVEADSLNAAVLGPDVDPAGPTFDMFIADVVRDMVQKAGQKCTAIRRVFVPAARVADVGDALGDALSRVELGARHDGDTVVGPLATASQRRDVLAGIAALERESTPLVAPSASVPAEGFFVAPRVYLANDDATGVHEHEVFGPVVSVIAAGEGDAAAVAAAVNRGGGGLVVSLYSDDPAWAGEVLLDVAPWHGRVHWGSAKVAGQSPGPGTVLPGLVHGGPGKAGGGEELGGMRGLRFYMQRTAVQADRALLDRALGS